ncbi:MAG: hypothetical protein M3R64_03105, partial [Pseudomonadota bacterium]|nr:hypothetical protein [Pseudomonadota bacterium]
PLVPAAPAAPVIDAASGKPIHRVIIRRVDNDGKVTTTPSDRGADSAMSDADADAMVARALAQALEVSERTCPNSAVGDERRLVLHAEKGTKKIMVICTNRIEAVAANAARTQANAADIQRHAMQTALASIDTARASITADRNLTEAQRKKALAGLDQAVAEMRAELGKD